MVQGSRGLVSLVAYGQIGGKNYVRRVETVALQELIGRVSEAVSRRKFRAGRKDGAPGDRDWTRPTASAA
jgi:hypothetical protein